LHPAAAVPSIRFADLATPAASESSRLSSGRSRPSLRCLGLRTWPEAPHAFVCAGRSRWLPVSRVIVAAEMANKADEQIPVRRRRRCSWVSPSQRKDLSAPTNASDACKHERETGLNSRPSASSRPCASSEAAAASSPGSNPAHSWSTQTKRAEAPTRDRGHPKIASCAQMRFRMMLRHRLSRCPEWQGNLIVNNYGGCSKHVSCT
jgi:hypothetical protein